MNFTIINWKDQCLGNLRLQTAHKIANAVIGFTVLAIGVAMLVLPGPALLVIPFGLALLATEFMWAKRWLQRTRDLIASRKRAVVQKFAKHEKSGPDAR